MRKHTSLVLPLAVSLVVGSLAVSQLAFAQSDPETAARQAQIDRDKAIADMQDVRRDESGQRAAQDATTQQMNREDSQVNRDLRNLADDQQVQDEAEQQDSEQDPQD